MALIWSLSYSILAWGRISGHVQLDFGKSGNDVVNCTMEKKSENISFVKLR